ncbi:MAG: molecular chaperone [Bacteroidales bacterium]|nr:molecular chaperone [Bacteroidales bacterium]
MSSFISSAKKRLTFIRSALLCILITQTFSFYTAFSQGDLLITPRRVVFDGSKRSIDVNLANTGRDTATYAISLVQIRMKEDGTFETITEPDPGQLFADKYIRYFPRSVTLGPNESQVVKVQLARQGKLAPGEYRSHFYFRAIPKAQPLGEEEKVRDTTTISVVLKPVYGITIPVIIRVGESTTKVTLSGLSLDMVNDAGPVLSLTINRSGNMSVYGDLAVYHISPEGKETKVGAANGIAVYTPNTIRNFRLNLQNVPGVDYNSGKLKAIFSAPSDVKPEKYAEAELMLKE